VGFCGGLELPQDDVIEVAHQYIRHLWHSGPMVS
jgi:hypothetical protein